MNIVTRLVFGKETKDAVSARFKTRSKDRFKWTTMVEAMKTIKTCCG